MKNKILNKKKLAFLSVVVLLLSTLIIIPSVSSYSDPTDPTTPGGYDMTYPGSDIEITRTINDAIWASLPSTEATGSGVFDAFFRVQAPGSGTTERGYNTDGRPLQFDEKTSLSFTHAAELASVPIVEYPDGSGNYYYEFQLDINELTGDGNISLDSFQVWTTNNRYQLGYVEGTPSGSFTSGANLVYDLDGEGDTWIMMDYLWNTGSGKRDYRVLVPESDFSPYITDKYVIIFTRHGDHWDCDDGYEEWGVAIYPTQPDTMVQLSTSAIGDEVQCGDSIDLTISEANSGTQPLTAVNVTVNANGIPISGSPFNRQSGSFVGGDDNGDGYLNVSETWTWSVPVVVNGDTNFSVFGEGWTFHWWDHGPHHDLVLDDEISYDNASWMIVLVVFLVGISVCMMMDGIYLLGWIRWVMVLMSSVIWRLVRIM
jgi:hypothetical protein